MTGPVLPPCTVPACHVMNKDPATPCPFPRCCLTTLPVLSCLGNGAAVGGSCWGTCGWRDAPRACPSVLAVLPAAWPTHGVLSSPLLPVSPQHHPHVLPPAVPRHHQGSVSSPLGPPWPHCQGCPLAPGSSQLCIVLMMLVFLVPPCPIPSCPAAHPTASTQTPFPICVWLPALVSLITCRSSLLQAHYITPPLSEVLHRPP